MVEIIASGASERANGRASGPVLQSVFLVVLAYSAIVALGGYATVAFMFFLKDTFNGFSIGAKFNDKHHFLFSEESEKEEAMGKQRNEEYGEERQPGWKKKTGRWWRKGKRNIR